MQQVLLALSAVAAFAYLALGQQRAEHGLDERGTAALVELAAVDLASARVEGLMGMTFDEGDVGAVAPRATPSDHPLGPDVGEAAPAAYDDVDDWDGYDAEATAAAGRGTLRFRERVTVRYVLDADLGTPATGPTLSKEIVVTLEEIQGADAGRAPARAELRRVVTPVGLAIDHATR